jgi:hypothetical protein
MWADPRLRLQAAEPRLAAERACLDARTATSDASLRRLSGPQKPSAASNPLPSHACGTENAALLATNAARNAATAARRTELVEQARAIAKRRAGEPTSTWPRAAGVKPALADRLAALLDDLSGGRLAHAALFEAWPGHGQRLAPRNCDGFGGSMILRSHTLLTCRDIARSGFPHDS